MILVIFVRVIFPDPLMPLPRWVLRPSAKRQGNKERKQSVKRYRWLSGVQSAGAMNCITISSRRNALAGHSQGGFRHVQDASNRHRSYDASHHVSAAEFGAIIVDPIARSARPAPSPSPLAPRLPQRHHLVRPDRPGSSVAPNRNPPTPIPREREEWRRPQPAAAPPTWLSQIARSAC